MKHESSSGCGFHSDSPGNPFVHSLLVTLGNHALPPSSRTIALVRPAISGKGVRPDGVSPGDTSPSRHLFLGADVPVLEFLGFRSFSV